MQQLALFPLQSVLFPGARMALQIFEPRYLDLVGDSLKQQSGFGVVWIQRGSEVVIPGQEQQPELGRVGTYAEIVDWDALPNGRLGITIEGRRRFKLHASECQANQLHVGEISWLPESHALAVEEEDQGMVELLDRLMEHPHLQRLSIKPDYQNLESVGNILAQVLPIAEATKFELLAHSDPQHRVDEIRSLLETLSE